MTTEQFTYTDGKVYYNETPTLHIEQSLVATPADARGNVTFTYVNVKTGRRSSKPGFSYDEAVGLAYRRMSDRRYKNFEFYID